MEKWISIKDRLPDKDGIYLVTYRSVIADIRFIRIYCYSNNLSKVDKYDFPRSKYNRAGWYDYDSEYGHWEVTNVIAWMELPEEYKYKGEQYGQKRIR